MKKSLMLAAAALALMTAGQAHADEDFKYTPYVGIDYTYSNAYADSMKPNYNSGSVNVGTMYNQFFGTELFYQYSDSATKGKHFDDRTKTSFQAGGLDLFGYLPLGCERRFHLLGTAGVGMYRFRKSYESPAIKGGHDSGYGYRLGAGMMYDLNDKWSVRALARHVNLDKVEGFDHMMEYSAGIRYSFYD